MLNPSPAVIAAIKRENLTFPKTGMVEILQSEWHNPLDREPRLQVWRNRFFLVQMFSTDWENVQRLSITRCELDASFQQWRDGISWDDILYLKRECGFAQACAVEIYPPDADLVNVANVRHIWLVPPDGLPFMWRRTPT